MQLTTNFSNLSEKELILLLQENNRQAIAALYYSHVDELKRFILKVAKSPQLTEDVVHDAFIKIWENRAQINPELAFKPYLYTIARRQLFNLLKRTKHEIAIVDEIKRYTVLGEHTTELTINYNESDSLFNIAINKLPKQCREIFIKCKVRGRSYKQVALELGLAESTVNNQMVKALKSIRQFLSYQDPKCLFFILICYEFPHSL